MGRLPWEPLLEIGRSIRSFAMWTRSTCGSIVPTIPRNRWPAGDRPAVSQSGEPGTLCVSVTTNRRTLGRTARTRPRRALIRLGYSGRGSVPIATTIACLNEIRGFLSLVRAPADRARLQDAFRRGRANLHFEPPLAKRHRDSPLLHPATQISSPWPKQDRGLRGRLQG